MNRWKQTIQYAAKKYTGLSIAALFCVATLAFGCKQKANASQNVSNDKAAKAIGANPSTPQAAPKDPKKLYKVKGNALKVTKGKKGSYGFKIKLVSGAKIHPKAPFQCQIATSAGLKATKKTLGHPDTKSSRDKKTKLMTVSVGSQVTATNGGKQHVKMDCSFFVCTKDLCMRTTEKVTIAGNIK